MSHSLVLRLSQWVRYLSITSCTRTVRPVRFLSTRCWPDVSAQSACRCSSVDLWTIIEPQIASFACLSLMNPGVLHTVQEAISGAPPAPAPHKLPLAGSTSLTRALIQTSEKLIRHHRRQAVNYRSSVLFACKSTPLLSPDPNMLIVCFQRRYCLGL